MQTENGLPWHCDPEELAAAMRLALRRVASSVAIVTLVVRNRRMAMAATSMTGLSLDPPSLLVCVNKSASMYGEISRGTPFCINVLGRQNLAVAQCCSIKSGEERFTEGEWFGGVDEPPYLADAEANLFCQLDGVFSYGTHGILIGRAVSVRVSAAVDPLIYVDGRFVEAGAPA